MARARRHLPCRPALEQLEGRCVPAAQTPATCTCSGLITSNTEWLDTSGTYTITGALTVASGATLTIGANVRVLIQSQRTLTVQGTLTAASGAQLTDQNSNFSSTSASGITIASGGVMTATGATFDRASSSSELARLLVSPGGRLTATGSTFDWSLLDFDYGSILNNGDLANNTFRQTVQLPVTSVPRLTGNLQFQDVHLRAGNLPAGQTLALDVLGANPAQRYVLAGDISIDAGATVNVGANARVLIQSQRTLTVNGTLNLATGVRVTDQNSHFSSTSVSGIVVGNAGVMTVTNATLDRVSSSSEVARLQVNAGGRLTATGSTFDWDLLAWDNGSLLSPGTVTSNTFRQTVQLPAAYVPRLTDNILVRTVQLLAGSLPAGQTLALNPIGTDPANMSYVLTGDFTIDAGATVNVGANARVLIQSQRTLTVNGTLNFASGARVTDQNSHFSSSSVSGIVVGNGGVLTARSTTFDRVSSSSELARLQVNAGGRLSASDCTFDWGLVAWDDGSLLSDGNLVRNIFAQPIQVPAGHVPRLTANRQFRDVQLLAGSLPSGQTLALLPLGTDTAVFMRYVLAGNFTIDVGATVNVGTNARVLIQSQRTLTVNGTLNLATGVRVTDQNSHFSSASTSGIVVGGVMTANNTTFDRANSSSEVSHLQVNAGGRLTVLGGVFDWDRLTLNGGSATTLSFLQLASQGHASLLTVDGGARVAIANNNFANVGANGVVTSGDANAQIDLRNNYWGITSATQVDAKILHRPDAPVNTRPEVLYDPWLNTPPPLASLAGLSFDDQNGNGTRDSGEPGLAGILVFLDTDNNGAFDPGEPSTTTRSDDPNTSGADETGQYRFDNLAPGTYVVRQFSPANFGLTTPSPGAVATTVFFDGTGAEAGITTGGTGSFAYRGAAFSGGNVFSPGVGGLRASGTQAYDVSSGSGAVDFSRPVASASFFYVHGGGFAAGTATAYAADGSALGTVNSNLATTNGDPANVVTLGGFAQPIARITFSAGIVDDFSFNVPGNNQAYLVRLQPGQQASGILFGNRRVGAVLTQTGGTTAVTEAGATDTYTLVLLTQPAANVTITLLPDNQVRASAASVVFTRADWDVPQTITIQAVEDTIVEGAHAGRLRHTVASNDANYNGLVLDDVVVAIADNDTPLVMSSALVTSADEGGPPTVKLFSPSGTLLGQFDAYGSAFTGGVRVAMADITGDGVPELFTAPGPGGQPFVNIFDSRSFARIRQVQVYGLSFTAGINLAVADVLGTGTPQIITAPDRGGQPFVNVTHAVTGQQLRSFLAYGQSFTLGVRVATGDVTADGRPDIVTAPQEGGSPFVNRFDGQGNFLGQFQVYGSAFTGGLYLAMGDVSGDGVMDLLVGPGPGGQPVVNAFDTRSGTLLRQYQVGHYGEGFTGGLRVGAVDVNRDNIADILIGPGRRGQPFAVVLDGATRTQLQAISAYDAAMTSGVFVVGTPL